MTIDTELAIAVGTGLLVLGGQMATLAFLSKRVEGLGEKVHDLAGKVATLQGLPQDMERLEAYLWRLTGASPPVRGASDQPETKE